MSHTLRASFYLRARHAVQQSADSCGDDTASVINSARGLAKAWIENDWFPEYPSRPLPSREELDIVVKEFWFVVLLAAVRSSRSEDQESLIQVVRQRLELGTLMRPEGSVAETNDGLIWTDLPHLRAALFDKFLETPPIVSDAQWLNLHSFAARLTAGSLRDVLFYAIWAMHDALEVLELGGAESVIEGRDSVFVPRVERLKIVEPWLEHCGAFIHRACLARTIPPDQRHKGAIYAWTRPEPEFVGILAFDAGVKEAGFSTERWAFWKSRLSLIRNATHGSAEGSDLAVVHQSSVHLTSLMEKAEAASAA